MAKSRLGSDFGKSAFLRDSALASAGALVVKVAAKHNVTYLGDPDHRDPLAYQLAGNEDTVRGLAEVGVKHFALEMFQPHDEALLKAYHENKISDRTMEYMVRELEGFDLVEDYLNMDNSANTKATFDLVKNAKAHGIQVHGLNGSEGFIDPEEGKKAYSFLSDIKMTAANAIENDPRFFELPKKKQADFIVKSLYDAGYNDPQVRVGLENLGLRKITQLPNMDDDNLLSKRLNADYQVVWRLEDLTQGEKTVGIYGDRHLARQEDDLDANTPDSVVIMVHRDKRALDAELADDRQESEKKTGMKFEDSGDYTIDLKTNIWRDENSGESYFLTIPEKRSSVPELNFSPAAAPTTP